MDKRDPFDFLMNAGSDPQLWVMIGGPVLLLVLVAVTYGIVVAVRNRRDAKELQRAVDEESKHITAEPAAPATTPASATKESERKDVAAEAAPAPVAKAPAPVAAPAPAPVAEPENDVEEIRRSDRGSWLSRLSAGLAKSRDAFRKNLEGIFLGKTKIDADLLEKLHEGLYRADIGVATADKLVARVKETLGKDDNADWHAVARSLKASAAEILASGQKPLVRPEKGPWVILIVGVNGVGKTTTIGKLAAHFLAQDQKVLLAAGDTFRAAAIEQLEIWGKRLGVDVVKHKQGADPAAVAYDAVKAAMARQVDVLIIDTAGRLHSKNELMAELGKVTRVIGKDLPGAPHETWLVVDSTTGQNAVQQVKAFREVAGVTGLVVTKLDGTAKGGVVIGIVDQFGLPVRFIGVGEKAKDLRDFVPAEFVESLF